MANSPAILDVINETETDAELLCAKSLPCISLDSFYYAVTTLFTKPEASLKAVFSSVVDRKKFQVSGDINRKILSTEPLWEKVFLKPFSGTEAVYFKDINKEQVKLERLLLLKKGEKLYQTYTEIWDFKENTISVAPISRRYGVDSVETLVPMMAYSIHFNADSETVFIEAYGIRERDVPIGVTLFHDMLERLRVWLSIPMDSWNKEIRIRSHIPKMSLQYVDRLHYWTRSRELKEKFLSPMAELWKVAKESTDPCKFVPEDIYIATYLDSLRNDILLFPQHEPKYFVDLGCGNGLLTFILCNMGWSGYGVDARKRKMWDFFPETEDFQKELCFRELTLTAANVDELLGINEQTIIIGNHPDELSFLIPFIARKKGAASFILIPCCAFGIYGEKYIRRDSEISVYEDYIKHLIQFSKDLGFRVVVDRLRIPSTKKIVILGSLVQAHRGTTTEEMENIIGTTRVLDIHRHQFSLPLPGALVPTRNCTKLPREEVKKILLKIFNFILNVDPLSIQQEAYLMAWNAGGQAVTLKNLVDFIGTEELQLLKAQNKGLQTLIRNHPNVFKFEDGFVRLQTPSLDDVANKRKAGKWYMIRTRQCFFKFNHPQGCPMRDRHCIYSHELKSRPMI